MRIPVHRQAFVGLTLWPEPKKRVLLAACAKQEQRGVRLKNYMNREHKTMDSDSITVVIELSSDQ